MNFSLTSVHSCVTRAGDVPFLIQQTERSRIYIYINISVYIHIYLYVCMYICIYHAPYTQPLRVVDVVCRPSTHHQVIPVVRAKILHYRQFYLNRPGPIAFMSVADSQSTLQAAFMMTSVVYYFPLRWGRKIVQFTPPWKCSVFIFFCVRMVLLSLMVP
jgi:hypothetical protein